MQERKKDCKNEWQGQGHPIYLRLAEKSDDEREKDSPDGWVEQDNFLGYCKWILPRLDSSRGPSRRIPSAVRNGEEWVDWDDDDDAEATGLPSVQMPLLVPS